jgi:hypothetical protein
MVCVTDSIYKKSKLADNELIDKLSKELKNQVEVNLNMKKEVC